jgi:hypothetical protein
MFLLLPITFLRDTLPTRIKDIVATVNSKQRYVVWCRCSIALWLATHECQLDTQQATRCRV